MSALLEGAGTLDRDHSTLIRPPRTVSNLTTANARHDKDNDGVPSAAQVGEAARKRNIERPRSSSKGSGFIAAGAHINGTARTVVRLQKVARPSLKHRVRRAVIATNPGVNERGPGFTRGPREQPRQSLTTGVVSVNGRGLTGGWGLINGTGMVREAVHHVRIGRFNGSGRTRSAAMASRDGMTNGSGLTEGSGMATDAGMTNGSGLTHGTGMTNGNGLVKPPTGTLPPRDVPTRRHGTIRNLLGI